MTIPDSGSLMDNESLCLPCTPEEERRIVKELTEKAESCLKEGNLYYVVSIRWFTKWQKYVGEEISAYQFKELSTDKQAPPVTKASERPGPIDNTDIITNEGDRDKSDLQISRLLLEGSDYVLVPQGVWEKLHGWYKGGPALPRKMIALGIQGAYTVEVYPLALKLIDSRDKSEIIIHISKKASLRELYKQVSALKGVELEKFEQVHIWDYFNDRRQSALADSNQTLEESNLQMDQSILLDVQVDGFIPSGFGMDSTGNELALVPMEPQRSSRTIAGGPSLSNGYSADYGSSLYQGSALSSISTDMEDAHDSVRTAPGGDRGLAGLQNLGNTCFMNSALQCLVHTPPLVEYFLQDYTDEINKQNPLGMHGELAVAFGELLRKLWSSGRTSVPPRAFKGKLARFAPQFSGYNQHDSQELLAFLLDGLHEDLNRVKQKPYFETKDSDGRPDEEVANEFWSYHKARNDSIVVDVCQGQYKSTLVCPVCDKISITFDPFMYLSLPLPSTATRSMTVTVFYGDGSSLPMPFTVNVSKHGYSKDLFQALATACCLGSDEILVLAEVYEHHIYRYLENGDSLHTIKDDECIVAYRLSKKQAEFPKLEICHRYLENLKPGERKRFLTPLVTYLEGAKNGADIELAVNRVLVPLKRKVFSSLNRSDGPKVNGSASEASEESTSDCTELGNPSKDKDFEDEELSFRLCLTDDRGMSCRPILKNSVIKSSKIVKVMLDWTDKEHELYDASYLKDLPMVHKPGVTVKKTKQESISLFSCLDAFLKEEPLGPDDMWYCPGCKEHRQATKKLDLWRLPDIIVFHLKRFSYSRFLKNKLDTFVNFPIHNLDLSKYVKNKDASGGSSVYELYAISNHYGGLGGGHYSAYAKLVEEDRWYHFDDAHVTPVSEGDIRTAAAYLLFYQRVKTNSVPTNGPVGESSKVHEEF
ncbi:ubiquitin carboxyl-terminal hydrolase 9-like isoform X1 [Cynara cardunculus var. scolymus]|uniref:ubiquitin carboxyl-terminal hydrolase 9-like isoform X1 n=1 Tax=Cynara cardunculus var. scolymus TaxID=59895 RepID=UPI000D62DBAF|nr:ubiquitin carboxyl-terminal hydrolase 9-like isoform X1 [Cynara cardunculus var. scolymus]